jgi:hypothetical protein
VHDSSVAHETNDLDIQEITQNIGTVELKRNGHGKLRKRKRMKSCCLERNQASMLSFWSGTEKELFSLALIN